MSILCKYNELDLPERITFDDGKRIYYTYAADGRKLRVRYAQLNSHVGPITPIDNPFPMGGGTAGLNGGGLLPLGRGRTAPQVHVEGASLGVSSEWTVVAGGNLIPSLRKMMRDKGSPGVVLLWLISPDRGDR